jgi:hypothetical protein
MQQDAETRAQYQHFIVICYVRRHESLEIGPIVPNSIDQSEEQETEDGIWMKVAQDLVQWQGFMLPMLDFRILLH